MHRTVLRFGLLAMVAVTGSCGFIEKHFGKSGSKLSTPRAAPQLPTDTVVATDVVSNQQTVGPNHGSFEVSADGEAIYQYPLWVPVGRAGIQPNLTLTYHSRGKNGPIGIGWTLSGLSQITRCRKTIAQDGQAQAIQFDSSDPFCLDGRRLVPIVGANGADGTEYRTEIESYTKVISHGNDSAGPLSFQVFLKNGHILTYGGDNDTSHSRIEGQRVHTAPIDLSGVSVHEDDTQFVRFAWSLSRLEDRAGNAMDVRYAPMTANSLGGPYEQLPSEIDYTSNTGNSTQLAPFRSVQFTYEPRPDTTTQYIGGLHLVGLQRLKRVDMYGPNPSAKGLLRSYILSYGTSSTGNSILQSIIDCDGLGVCTPPTTFQWEAGQSSFFDYDTGVSTSTEGGAFTSIQVGDFDGDGNDDIAYRVLSSPTRGAWYYRLSGGYSTPDKPTQPLSGAQPLPLLNQIVRMHRVEDVA